MRFVFTLLIGLVTGGSLSMAQNFDQTQIDGYSSIATGWWLNLKCNRLSKEFRREFEWHFHVITQKLQERMGRPPIHKAQKDTRRAADSTKCDRMRKSIITSALREARKTGVELSNAAYSLEKYYQLRSEKFLQTSTALGLEERCQFFKPLARQTLAILYDLIATELNNDKQDTLVSRGRTLRNRPKDDPSEKCTAEARDFVLNGLGVARDVAVDLGVW